MERIGGERSGESSSYAQVLGASLIGTTIECCDFFVHITAAGHPYL